ncbi:hypothetical protein [Oscillatoria nigro-viridis]|uniref:hypothetical protein n=1 Tax=Phormidium nigroviride TaxID=482564 RepID=UPI00167F84E2|nr:hypothetical protein [Oscillatoria nigro-viridis]
MDTLAQVKVAGAAVSIVVAVAVCVTFMSVLPLGLIPPAFGVQTSGRRLFSVLDTY